MKKLSRIHSLELQKEKDEHDIKSLEEEAVRLRNAIIDLKAKLKTYEIYGCQIKSQSE